MSAESSLKSTPISRLAEEKARLGEIVHLDLRGLDLVTAHHHLGVDVREQVQYIFGHRIAKWDIDELHRQIRVARNCKVAILEKIDDTRTIAPVRSALAEYLECLAAWSTGTGLDCVVSEVGATSGDELALVLQNDNVGCQTGVIRLSDGSVAFWHTEEDVDEEWGSRFDKLRLAWFEPPDAGWDGPMAAFIYPDLLPGPAFAWRSEWYAQAVDSLFLKPDANHGRMLANVASWVTLRLATTVETARILEVMAPFRDGCAFVTVHREGHDVHAQRIEFTGSWLSYTALGADPGAYLFQTNIITDQQSPFAVVAENLDQVSRPRFEQRIARTRRAVNRMNPSKPALPSLCCLMASRAGGEMAYANVDVKAHTAGRISLSGAEIWVEAGPALPGEHPVPIWTR
jgi:hypothetical protein